MGNKALNDFCETRLWLNDKYEASKNYWMTDESTAIVLFESKKSKVFLKSNRYLSGALTEIKPPLKLK